MAGTFRAGVERRPHELVVSWVFQASSSFHRSLDFHKIQAGGCDRGEERARVSKTRQKVMKEILTKGNTGSTSGKGTETNQCAAFQQMKTAHP